MENVFYNKCVVCYDIYKFSNTTPVGIGTIPLFYF